MQHTTKYKNNFLVCDCWVLKSSFFVEKINSFLETLAAYKSNYVSVYNIGSSFEKRKLDVIKFNVNPSVSKRAIWIDCGIHAREWAAISTCVWIIDSVRLGHSLS